MNAKENYLEAIRFGRPAWVPLGNENVWYSFQFEGNFRQATWTDGWGIDWEVGLEGTAPFPKGNPLPCLERLAEYRFPNAGDLAGIGVSILNPVQARANDLAKIKAATTGRMALHGAIDTAILASGRPGDVRVEVIRILEILKPGGGYICTPDQSIPGIPEENMTALWETAREVGRY